MLRPLQLLGLTLALSTLVGCGHLSGVGPHVGHGGRPGATTPGTPGTPGSDPTQPGDDPSGNPPAAGGAIRVFFTNTYAAAQGGMSAMAAKSSNQASAQADPNNPDRQLASLIDRVAGGATLDGAFYDIGVDDVVQAFARAAKRGVKVRLVTDGGYYYDNGTSQVRPAIQTLQAAGIPVKPRPKGGGLMHDKFLVVNGQSVWTGSYNITDGGSYADNNNALELDSPALAALYAQEFAKMFDQGNFGPDAGAAIHPAPRTVAVGSAQVTPYFSPNRTAQNGAKQAIMTELSAAHSSIQFLAFSFTDTDMGRTMLAKAQSGVKVAGVFERGEASTAYCQYNTLAPQMGALAGSLDVRLDNNPGLMHHKVIIVDGQTLMVGSFNFSDNAQLSNDENMLVIKNAPELVASYQHEFSRILALSSAGSASASSVGGQSGAGSSASGRRKRKA